MAGVRSEAGTSLWLRVLPRHCLHVVPGRWKETGTCVVFFLSITRPYDAAFDVIVRCTYTSTVTTLSLQFAMTCTHTFDRCFKSTANVVTRWRPDTTATAFSVTCRAIWKIPPCLSLVHVIFTLFCSAISIPVDFFYLFRRSFGVSVRCSCWGCVF